MVKTFIVLLFLATAAFATNNKFSLETQRANKCYMDGYCHSDAKETLTKIYEYYRTGNGTLSETEAKTGRRVQRLAQIILYQLSENNESDKNWAGCYTICTGVAAASGRTKTACFFGGLLILKVNGIRTHSFTITELRKHLSDFIDILDAVPFRPDPPTPPTSAPWTREQIVNTVGLGLVLWFAPWAIPTAACVAGAAVAGTLATELYLFNNRPKPRLRN